MLEFIAQKVKSNDAKRTESLAQTLFEDQIDNESVSKEMYFLPPKLSVKRMADIVREKDRIYKEQMEEEEIRISGIAKKVIFIFHLVS